MGRVMGRVMRQVVGRGRRPAALAALGLLSASLTTTLVGASPADAAAPPGPNSVVAFGTAATVPGAGGVTALPGPTVAMAATPDGNGYWVVTAAGQVTAEGDAPSYGSLTGITLNKPVVGMAAVPGGGGYWLVAADGGIFSFGDAPFYGSTGGMTLNKPVVGMAAVPGGGGYWLVAADGGIFSFGDAPFYGAGTGGSLTAPAVGMAARTGGYWIAYGQTADVGTPLGQEELLARLGYLPLDWSPPLGFQWRWPNIPPQLAGLWSPGQDDSILQGAIWAFEAVAGLPTDGQISGPESGALLAAANDPSAHMNPNGYTYSLVQEHSGAPEPETLTVWHTGTVVQQTAANTGIAVSPTAIGTFPVYLRYRNQVMTGTNPTGTPYADPVQYVAYFTTGDAIHFMPRAQYGYPQSLGCVEIPIGPASVIWQYTYLGSLVTVTPS